LTGHLWRQMKKCYKWLTVNSPRTVRHVWFLHWIYWFSSAQMICFKQNFISLN
jgi:hypothetical protein